MDGWIIDILKTYGLAGLVIFVLGGVCAMLWRRIGQKDVELARLNAERAEERETLVKLIEVGNGAALLRASAAEKQNVVLGELGSAVAAQVTAVDRHRDRVENQAEMLKEKFADFRHVVDSFGESNRVISGLLTEARNTLTRLEGLVGQVMAAVAAQASKP